ncbi:MAG: STAS domain-containing protein [Solirubrobacteraceae bacterium]
MAPTNDGSPNEVLRIELSSDGEAGCVILQGELDLSVVDQAEGALRHAERNGHNVIVDFTALDFMDLAGLRVILAAHQRLGQRLILRGCSPPVHRLFELAGVAKQLPLVPEHGRRDVANDSNGCETMGG